MSEGGRDSGAKPAVVYIPAGRYLISGTIDVFSSTQLLGEDRKSVV